MDRYVAENLVDATRQVFDLFRIEKPYTSLMIVLARNDKFDMVLDMIREHPYPDVIEAAIRGYGANSIGTIKLFQFLLERETTTTNQAIAWLTIALQELIKRPENGQKAYDLIQLFRKFHADPVDSVYKLAIQCCLSSGMLHEANDLASYVNEFMADDAHFVRQWPEVGSRAAAARTEAMLARLTAPSMLAFNVFMQSIVMSAHPESGQQIEEVLDQARERGLDPDAVSFELALNFYGQSSSDDLSRGERLLKTIKRPTLKQFKQLIEGKVRLRDARGARDLFFRQIEDFVNFDDPSLRPQMEHVFLITRIFIKSNEIGKARKFLPGRHG